MLKTYEKRIGVERKRNMDSKSFKFAEVENMWYFQFTPSSGAYAGQTHVVSMDLVYGVAPDVNTYPVSPPNCKFVTHIWHPNVSLHGPICVSTLNTDWSLMTSTASIISSIELLLLNPNPSSPMNAEAVGLTEEETAQKIKETYSKPSRPSPFS